MIFTYFHDRTSFNDARKQAVMLIYQGDKLVTLLVLKYYRHHLGIERKIADQRK